MNDLTLSSITIANNTLKGGTTESFFDFSAKGFGVFLHETNRRLQESSNDFYVDNKSWIDGLAIALGVQAILGIIAIEYAFARNKRLMYSKDEKRDEKFAAFARLDTDRWYRFKFYPGAMFSMPVRLLLLNLLGLLLLIIGK